MATRQVKVNRAPVLTLCAAVVAERLGYDSDEALTLGRAVAGLNAQSKGQRLGIFEPEEKTPEQIRAEKERVELWVPLLGRRVPAVHTPEGIRATARGKAMDPASVERYLKGKFGEALPEVREAMEHLARSLKPEELAKRAYTLYEQRRPPVPEGTRGWGAKGELTLEQIEELRERRPEAEAVGSTQGARG